MLKRNRNLEQVDERIGLFTLPVFVWYPLQKVLSVTDELRGRKCILENEEKKILFSRCKIIEREDSGGTSSKEILKL